MSDFDAAKVAALIAKHKPELLAAIERSIARELRSMPPHEALGFRLLDGEIEVRRITAEASIDYASILVAFMRQKEYETYTVDSFITPMVLDIIGSEVLAFYSSKDIAEELSDAIIREMKKAPSSSVVVKKQLEDHIQWVKREGRALTSNHATSMASTIVDASISQVQHFMTTAAGKAVIGAVSKAAATSAGQLALKRGLVILVQKVMASAAIKASFMSAIRKVGIAVLIKSAIGKAMIGLLALVGIAHVPIVWIILPLIAGFLVYEYTQFPEKLATKVPAEISRSVGERFGDLNERVVASILAAMFSTLEHELFDIQDRARDDNQRKIKVGGADSQIKREFLDGYFRNA